MAIRDMLSRRVLGAAALLLICQTTVLAAEYPVRSLRYVVAFGPGGLNDVVGRVFCQKLSEAWGQPVIVDNRPGAGGNVGAEAVARATPDGHTMLSISTAHAIAQTLYTKLNYSLERDLASVAILGTAPLMTVVHPSLPVKTVPELVSHAKSKRIAYASGGVGVISHLSMEMLKQAARFDATHVPYKGGGPALIDLLAGQVQFHSNDIGLLLGNVRAGKLRTIGMMTEKRHPLQPDVPTYVEQGFKDFVMGNWIGVVVPAGTPRAAINKLSAELTRIARLPDVVKHFADQGFDTTAMGADAMAPFVKKEVARFGAAVKASGAKAD
ncbi:MAG: tripartite tricarboxylate transporter substrate binding protein [Betaproteobacteria bacterium]|nr:MAG: tripartite tricarboxylate transporter substrate binding protein [Betaproteobacteria bacterium]